MVLPLFRPCTSALKQPSAPRTIDIDLGGMRLIMALADFVASAWLVAVSTTVCAAVIDAGAV